MFAESLLMESAEILRSLSVCVNVTNKSLTKVMIEIKKIVYL
jgi:hypothetical protein